MEPCGSAPGTRVPVYSHPSFFFFKDRVLSSPRLVLDFVVKMTLNFYFPSAGITSLYHHAMLWIQSRASCMLGKLSYQVSPTAIIHGGQHHRAYSPVPSGSRVLSIPEQSRKGGCCIHQRMLSPALCPQEREGAQREGHGAHAHPRR